MKMIPTISKHQQAIGNNAWHCVYPCRKDFKFIHFLAMSLEVKFRVFRIVP